MSTTEITNGEDFIDSRDVIARIDDLAAREGDEIYPLDEDEAEELATLRDLASQGAQYDDWLCGETLIRDSYFEDYARQVAEDIGAIADDAEWPATCIDWERAADELRMDYTSVEFDGVTYWVR